MLAEHKRYMNLLIDGGVNEDVSLILAMRLEEHDSVLGRSYCPNCLGFLMPASEKEINLGAKYRCMGRGCDDPVPIRKEQS